MDQPWKMLVYISADNTLYQDAQISLRQLTEASSSNNVDIIVQFDGPSPGDGSRYKCVGGKKELLWEADNQYAKKGRPQRLSDFLNSDEAVPKVSTATPPERQRIALVLWGHGAGLDHFYFYNKPKPAKENKTKRATAVAAKDSQSPTVADPNRYVKNIQLGKILEEHTEGIRSHYPEEIRSQYPEEVNFKIDLLGLDSCLMALVEICHEVSASVSLMVASDEVVPDSSWPYDSILGDLNKFPGMDANTLSAVIINRFRERYTQKRRKTRVSLSSMNLQGSDALVEAMEELVKVLDTATNQKNDPAGTAKRIIFRARDASRTPDEATYIDFGVFCQELSQSFSQEHVEESKRNPGHADVSDRAKNVHDMLVRSPYVIYHRDAGEDGSIDPYGLAIYFPPTLDLITSKIDAELKPEVMPRNDVKTPGVAGGKTPGVAGGKTPGVRGGKDTAGLLITGYEILWHDYHELAFNKKTRWAKLIYRLLGGHPTKYCSDKKCLILNK